MKPTAFDNFHPALALVYFAVALVLAMAAPHPILLALSFAVATLYGVWLRGGRAVARSFARQLPLLAVIVAVNPLFSFTGTTELFRIGTQAVYAEGYANAATMALLLLCVMQWFANADAVLGSDKVMGALGGILPTISLMISMIMRLIPQFVRRGHAISNALNACTAARNPSTTMVSGDVFAEEAESAPAAKEEHEAERARHQKRHAEQNGANKPAQRFPQFALPITCALSPRSWGGAWKTRWKPPIPCTAADGAPTASEQLSAGTASAPMTRLRWALSRCSPSGRPLPLIPS